jgi:hypothetical protein
MLGYGLPVDVFVGRYGHKPKSQNFVLYDPDGPMDGFVGPTDYPDVPKLVLRRDRANLGGYVYAVPATVTADGQVVPAATPPDHTDWTDGGHLVGTPDSRFARAVTALGAVPLHDRADAFSTVRMFNSD